MDFDNLLNDAGEGLVFDSGTYKKTNDVFEPSMIDDLINLLKPANWKIHTYCVNCKKEETFSVSVSAFELNRYTSSFSETSQVFLPAFSFGTIDLSSKTSTSLCFPEITPESEGINMDSQRTYFLIYTIRCDFDCETAYTIILRLVSTDLFRNGTVKAYKMGQVPPLYVINSGDANEYREILSDMGAYDDYLKAIKSHQQNLEAGACCYLRRALSHMIQYYAKKNSLTLGANDTTATKLKTLEGEGIITTDAKEILDPLYSDLSEGDHSLEETDNNQFYPSLLGALQFQLADAQAKRDYEKKKASVKKNLDSVTRVIGNKH
jgi:hypothetical protein